MSEKPNKIVFFDGHCGLCHGSVKFALKHDKKGLLKFTSLHSDFAKEHLPSSLKPANEGEFTTILFLQDGVFYNKSRAIIEILSNLGGVWKLWGLILFLIPFFIRDFGYEIISLLRFKMFGRLDVCPMPEPHYRSRFIY